MTRSRVLLLVTGGIAAYKSCLLARLLVQAGFSVRVAMTGAAQRFVGPTTFRALTGHGVATDLWGEGDTDPLDHVELARWADIAVVAPATANLLGKAAGGLADDIVTTLLLACERDLVLAPAMNDAMWRHPAVQANLATLRGRGAHVVDPGRGWLACGTVAEGRMAEPEEIFARICELDDALPPRADGAADLPLAGCRLLVTAGPTREPLDAVRFVGNRSTGAMGFALARQAAGLGAEVTLIHGPVPSPPPRGIGVVVPVETAAQMAAAVRERLPRADALIMAAAVADFTPESVGRGKLKKESLGTSWCVNMTRTTDILADIVHVERHAGLKVVGFALETENLLERATAKLHAKGMDAVIANDPVADGTFGEGLHRVTLIAADGGSETIGPLDKRELAAELLRRLVPLLSPAGSEA